MINILIIGSGAREHILAKRLFASKLPKTLYCFGTNYNPGILQLCKVFTVGKLTDNKAIVIFAKQQAINLVIIGPELPLATGLADAFQVANISCIGPTQCLAQIETSKGFTRDLLKRYNIPGSLEYYRFKQLDGVLTQLQKFGTHYVIKADGLMGGKGVKLSGEHLANHQEALAYCQELLNSQSGFVLEEKLIGEEFSLLSFVSGSQLIHMPAVQDHKRAFENDQGPNTGGMGTYSAASHALPFLSQQDILYAQQINEQVAKALQKECQVTYMGILYGSFIKTAQGIKIIEFNARFGDPEVINLLTLLKTDFLELCLALVNKTLSQLPIEFEKAATVCKYLVPRGYPDQVRKGLTITIGCLPENVELYYGAIDQQNDKLIMTGSRAVALVSKADSIQQAATNIELALSAIHGEYFYRKDIGSTKLINQRIAHINQLCHQVYKLL